MPAPINLDFEQRGVPGIPPSWAIVGNSHVRVVNFGRMTFDVEVTLPVGGEFDLPPWLEIECPTTDRTARQGVATIGGSYGADAARMYRADGDAYGLLVEPARVNYLHRATDADLAPWAIDVGSGIVVTADAAVDPIGVLVDADEIDFTPAAVGQGIYDDDTTGPDGPQTWSVTHWIQRSGALDVTVTMENEAGVVGTFPFVAGAVWSIAQWTETVGPGIEMKPYITKTVNNTIFLWGSQKEVGAYPTSLILTTGADKTRAVETLKVNDASACLIDGGYFEVVLKVAPLYANNEPTGDHDLVWFDADNRLFYRASDNKFVLRLDGVNLESGACTFSRDQKLTITASHLQWKSELTVAGATAGNGTTTATAQAALVLTSEYVYILGNASGTQEGAALYLLDWNLAPSVEAFERAWGCTPYATEIDPTLAAFDSAVLLTPLAYDSFEAVPGWDAAYLFQLASTAGAQFDTTLENAEDYEEEWTIAPQTWDLVLAAPVVGTFSGAHAFESFVADDGSGFGWDLSYATTITPTAANFDDGFAEAYEDFEEVKLRQQIAVAPATDLIIAAAHGFLLNDRVSFVSTGALPGGLGEGTLYYVVAPNPGNFQVSYTAGGAAIDLTNTGTGVHEVVANEAINWTVELV